MSVKFNAELRTDLRQGDHVPVKVEYTDENGATKRVTAAILPEPVAVEFVKLINGTAETHSESHTPRTP